MRTVFQPGPLPFRAFMAQAAPFPVPLPGSPPRPPANPANAPTPAGTITVPYINQQLPATVAGFPTKTVLIGGAVILGGLLLLRIL